MQAQLPIALPISTALGKLTNHQVVILGMGREGISSYSFIRHHAPELELWLIDQQPLEKLDSSLTATIETDNRAHFVFGSPTPHSPHLTVEQLVSTFSDQTVVVKTAGIPLTHSVVAAARGAGGQITSNMQIFFDVIGELAASTSLITIGITGTKGKSTTTSMVHHLLKTAQWPAYLGGNIGVPALSLLTPDLLHQLSQPALAHPHTFVLELSSHQLESLKSSPNIAIVQAVTSEHLDYYPNTEAYAEAKTAITRYQNPDDTVFYYADNDTSTRIGTMSPGKKIPFSLAQDENDLKLPSGARVSQDQLSVVGHHTLINLLPSILLAQELDIDEATLRTALTSFRGLPDRLEYLGSFGGFVCYNDSLATTPEATIAAIAAFTDRDIYLIAGGYERHQDYRELAKAIVDSTTVKAVAALPTTGSRLVQEIAQIQPADAKTTPTPTLAEQPTMEAAVTWLIEQSKRENGVTPSAPQPVLLLSPAAASFNMYKDYQARSQHFREVLRAL